MINLIRAFFPNFCWHKWQPWEKFYFVCNKCGKFKAK